MILVGGVTYDICIPTTDHNSVTLSAVYCGGSVVDSNGHHVGGGVWMVHNIRVSGWARQIIPMPESGRTDYCRYDDNGRSGARPGGYYSRPHARVQVKNIRNQVKALFN